MIFSIAMGADYSFYVKSIAICAPIFFGYIISVLVSVGDAVKSFFFLPAYFLIGFQEALLLVCQADILRV